MIFFALFGQTASVESDLSYRRIFRLDVFIYVGAENYDDSASKIIEKIMLIIKFFNLVSRLET